MRILAVGDLVGESGVKKLKEELPRIKQQENIDFIIVNAENSAGGMGITTKIYNELTDLGVDVITMGNHTWGKKDIFSFIDNNNIIRPANYSEKVPGHGYGIYTCKNNTICVVSLIGRTDMNVQSENPFLKMQEILEEVKGKADIIILDFHAEATAEKIAMGYYLDGKVTAVFGTHTHVQTADEQILEKGTAYITDIGMTGPKKSVIGMDVSVSIKRFETTLPEKYKLAEGECELNGCIFNINDETCRVNKITRIIRK
ncbi:MAG: TIGR00282 family metallophosphoesterase [Clostridia bacterium]